MECTDGLFSNYVRDLDRACSGGCGVHRGVLRGLYEQEQLLPCGAFALEP